MVSRKRKLNDPHPNTKGMTYLLLQKQRETDPLKLFLQRVAQDGGTALVNYGQLAGCVGRELLNADVLLFPAARKAGKAYSILPLDGSCDFEVVRATPATEINSAGLIASVGNNVPRYDFDGSCPAFNPWEQRTNLLTFSQEFDDAAWGKANSTISANATTAPDNTLTADKIVEDSSTGLHYIQQGFSHTLGLVYTISFFAKAAERTAICLQTGTSFNFNLGNVGQFVDLTNGQPLNSLSGVTVRTQFIGGFWRISITTTAASTNTSNLFVLLAIGTSVSYAGNGTSGIFFWGAQLEAGSSASPYIPTTTAAVTRNSEVIRNTSASAYIGATQGAIAGRFIAGSNAGHIVDISTGATNNSIQIDYGNAGAGILRATVFTSGVPHTIISTTALSAGSHGFCFVYQSGNFALYVDGVLVGTNTAAFLPTGLDEIYIGSNIGTSSWFNGSIDHVRFFKEIPNNPANESAK